MNPLPEQMLGTVIRAALIWGLVQKWSARKLLVNALKAPAGTSESDVKAMPAPMYLGKVGAWLLAIGMSASLTACTKVNPVLVSAENAVYVAATRVDDEFRKVCTEQQLTAPCDDARPFVLELITAAKAFNRSVAAQNIGGLTDVIAAGGRLAEKVKALPSGKTVQLAHNIADAVTAAAKGAK